MSATERHYSVQELAEIWKVSEDTIRRLFREEPDVMKITGRPGLRKRRYVLLRLPESVVVRVHERLGQQVA